MFAALGKLAEELLGRTGGMLSRKFLMPLIIWQLLRTVSDMPTDRFYALVGAAVFLGGLFMWYEYRLDRVREERWENQMPSRASR